jgi:hypothetical protein
LSVKKSDTPRYFPPPPAENTGLGVENLYTPALPRPLFPAAIPPFPANNAKSPPFVRAGVSVFFTGFVLVSYADEKSLLS